MSYISYLSLAYIYMYVSLCVLSARALTVGEPTCSSRFEYERDVVHAIVKMQMDQDALKTQIGGLIRDGEIRRAKYEGDITALQKAHADESKKLTDKIQVLSEKVVKDCAADCQDGRLSAGYTYKDDLAQATCVALAPSGHVYAVRRTCSGASPDCATVCKTLGKNCVNSLHVYDRPNMKTGDVGKEGLKMYRYNSCGGGCGPNFCCCNG